MAKYEVIDGVGVITSGTTKIEDYAFQGCKNPESVTASGRFAFEFCSSLANINMPNGVTVI